MASSTPVAVNDGHGDGLGGAEEGQGTADIAVMCCNDIMKGVVICLSGYENPERGLLREKALRMGAQYRPDFADDVTHLCCAFAGNTPTILSAQRSGEAFIVKGDWITECEAAERKVEEGTQSPNIIPAPLSWP